jgi:hypothetical protein
MRTGVMRDLARARGVELASLIDECVDVLDRLSDADRLEVVAASARLDSWTASRRAEAIAAVHDSAVVDLATSMVASREESAVGPAAAERSVAGHSHSFNDQRLVTRRVGTEVSLVLGISQMTADREVDLALSLRGRPRLMQALADGELDRAQVTVILDEIGPVIHGTNETRLLTSLLGADDTPDGDRFDGDDVVDPDVVSAEASAQQVNLVRELRWPDVSLWSLVPGRLRHIVRREVARLEPRASQERAARARTERRVIFDDQPDFMSELHLRTTTDAAAAAFANLDLTARAARHAGDRRNLDQLRSDIAVGWLTEGAFGTLVTRPPGVHGGHIVGPRTAATSPVGARRSVADAGRSIAGGRRSPAGAARSMAREAVSVPARDGVTICLPRPAGALINITVAGTTMLDLDQEPAILHGPAGPITMPADLARHLAHSPQASRWRRLLLDKSTGVLTDISSGYHPPPRLDAFVRARDGHRSRLPTSCATRLELDHLRPYDRVHPDLGGPTSSGNLASGGRRDHHLKSDGALVVTGDANGTLTITAPSGRSYPSHPYPYADPQPPDPPQLPQRPDPPVPGARGDPPY